MVLKKGLRNFICTLFIFIAFNSFSVLAGDPEALLMHNNHDALIIGEITEIKEEKMLVQVEKQIINPKGGSRKQISVSDVISVDKIDFYAFYNMISEESEPKKGDYILASLNKTHGGFETANGIYKVNSKDYKTLNLIMPKQKTSNSYLNMTIAALNRFVNSDGNDSEFFYHGNKLYLGEELIYEYDFEAMKEKHINTTSAVVSEEDQGSLITINNLLFLFGGISIIVLGVLIYSNASFKRHKQ